MCEKLRDQQQKLQLCSNQNHTNQILCSFLLICMFFYIFTPLIFSHFLVFLMLKVNLNPACF